MTTQDIIKTMPLEEKEKVQFLNMYERGTDEQKIQIDILAWTSYFELHDDRVEKNLKDEIDSIKKGAGGPLDKTLYPRILKKTEEQLNKEASESIAESDLAMARVAMKQIVSEIQASKKTKKRTVKI